MRKAEEIMNEFIATLRNMENYQGVTISRLDLNYEDIEKAYREEKKIVATMDSEDVRKIKQISVKDDELEI